MSVSRLITCAGIGRPDPVQVVHKTRHVRPTTNVTCIYARMR